MPNTGVTSKNARINRVSIIALIVLFSLGATIGGARFAPLKAALHFRENVTTTIAMLIVITAFVERSVAAINGATIGVAMLNVRSTLTTTSSPPDENEPHDSQGGQTTQDMENKKAKLEADDQRTRIVVSFLFGLLISASGVRTLGSFVTAPTCPWQSTLLNFSDVILTAGLIAGGTHGLSTLLKLIKSQYPKTT